MILDESLTKNFPIGDFRFDEALQHLASLKTLDVSDVTVKEESLAAGLSRPPFLSRLVMQETMSDAQLMIKIVQFQTSLTHLDLSR